jgi:hypothetical protein
MTTRIADRRVRHLPWMLCAVLIPTLVLATEPCGPDTYFANPARPARDYAARADWIAVGRVIRTLARRVPYPNCALADRSRCAQWDRSELTVLVERYEKGHGPRQIVITSAMCAPDAPTDAAGRYRFFGRGVPFHYSMFEALQSPHPGASH